MIESEPLVSVIIPTYNRADLLPRAVKSVLSQSYRNLECLIIDDASTDNTEEVVRGLDDERVVYIRHERNRHGGAARNTGIRSARGEFIAFLDSDDIWHPQKLALQLAQIEQSSPQDGVFYCGYYRVIGNAIIESRTPSYEGNVRYHLLNGWADTLVSGLVVRKSLLEQEPFDEALTSFQDYDLLLRLSSITQFRCLPLKLVLLYQHPGDRVSRNPKGRARALSTLQAKWKGRLQGEELNLFDKFLRKYRQDLVRKQLIYEMQGELGKGILMALRNIPCGLALREIFKVFLLKLLGPQRYERLMIAHLKRKGLVIGYLPAWDDWRPVQI